MEQDTQRLFKNKYVEIGEREGEVVHIKTAAWVMRTENDPPTTRFIYRIDKGDKEALKQRLETIFSKMSDLHRKSLAMT